MKLKNLKIMHSNNYLRLNIPNLIIDQSGITAIVGHNGAGKSSLLKVIAGLEEPSIGNVLFNGKNTFYFFEELKRKIHLISWNISLIQNMSAYDHIELVKKIIQYLEFNDRK